MKILTDRHKKKSLVAAHEFLQHYENEGDELFDHIVRNAEMNLVFLILKSRQFSRQSNGHNQKFKQECSVKKLIATLFWRQNGRIVKFSDCITVVNANKQRKNVRTIKKMIWDAILWNFFFSLSLMLQVKKTVTQSF